MYERFTDRSRKVMQLANQEALSLNHEYIGTEHILLGMIKEGSGVAAAVLKNLNVDLAGVRLKVMELVQASPDPSSPGKLPQTPRAKKVIEYAIEEARNFNHNHVGTEHLLLGMCREGEGVASRVLAGFGVTVERVREEVLVILGHDRGTKTDTASSGKPEAYPVSVFVESYLFYAAMFEFLGRRYSKAKLTDEQVSQVHDKIEELAKFFDGFVEGGGK